MTIVIRHGKRIGAVFATAAIVSLLACDDDPVTQPLPFSVEGTWTFTIAPVAGGSEDDELDFDGVALTEIDGVVTGSYRLFSFEGTRRGDQVELSVLSPDGTDSHRRQTTMYLTLSPDSMVGGGHFVLPDIPTPLDTDGSTHPKYLADHPEAEIITGSQPYSIRAVRTGSGGMALRRSVGSLYSGALASGPVDDLCAAVGSIMSFAIGKVTGGAFRPMGGCWGRHDGGGYYAFGRYGPGSLAPLWTQTVYKAEEWAWCSVRTYHFAMTTGSAVTAIQAGEILIPAWVDANRSWLERTGINPDNRSLFYQQARELYDLTGGFAVSVAYSTHTSNWSIYFNTVRDVSKSTVLSTPLAATIVNHYYNEHGQSKVWVFAGKRIRDTFHMRRDPTGVCSSHIMFAYLFGTHDVEYD